MQKFIDAAIGACLALLALGVAACLFALAAGAIKYVLAN